MNNKLINYILTLTPEQVDKLVKHLPEIIALLKERNAA